MKTGITISTRVQFGRPCIAGTGVPAESVFERFIAGESVRELSNDYQLKVKQVECAIRYCVTEKEVKQ